MKKIREATAEGIKYIDESGDSHFIEFEVCHQNFVTLRQQQMGSQYTDELKQLDTKYRSVGYRKFSANPPYIEFYTIPPTRFEFPASGKFEQLAHSIRKAGWFTIDGD